MEEFTDAFENEEDLKKYRSQLLNGNQPEEEKKDNAPKNVTRRKPNLNLILNPTRPGARLTEKSLNSTTNAISNSMGQNFISKDAVARSQKENLVTPEVLSGTTKSLANEKANFEGGFHISKPHIESAGSNSAKRHDWGSESDSTSNVTQSADKKTSFSFAGATNQQMSRSCRNPAGSQSFSENANTESPQRTKSTGKGQTAKMPSWMMPLFGKKGDPVPFAKEVPKLNDKHQSDFSDITTLQIIPNENKKPTKGANASWVAKFSPDENYLAVGGADGVLKVFVVNNTPSYTLEEIVQGNIHLLLPKYTSYVKHTGDIIDLDWSADSKRIITASLDFKAMLWDLEKPEPLQIFNHCDIVSCVSFHPLVSAY